jgi:hypothetical protein
MPTKDAASVPILTYTSASIYDSLCEVHLSEHFQEVWHDQNLRMTPGSNGQQASSHIVNGTLVLDPALDMRVFHGPTHRRLLHTSFNKPHLWDTLCMEVFPINSLAVSQIPWGANQYRGGRHPILPL